MDMSIFYWAWIVQGVLLLAALGLFVLIAILIMNLTRLIRTLNDYWSLRTAMQMEASGAERHET